MMTNSSYAVNAGWWVAGAILLWMQKEKRRKSAALQIGPALVSGFSRPVARLLVGCCDDLFA
jgi:hypothetical protein